MPTSQTGAANFSKPRIDMDTMFSLKVAQDPQVHFRLKKLKKFSFVKTFFRKQRNFSVFFIFDPLNFRIESKYRVHEFVTCTNVS